MSRNVGALDEDDIAERGEKYVKHLSEIPSNVQHNISPNALFQPYPIDASVTPASPTSLVPSNNTANLFAFPAPLDTNASVDINAVISALSNATISTNDLEYMNHNSSLVSTAIDSLRIRDTGKVVLTFEEL